MTAKKKRELTAQQEAFLNVLMGEAEGDFRVAMTLAGYSETTPIRQLTNSLKEEIHEVTMAYLASAAPKAVARMISVLHKGDISGASNIIKAAQQILDRAGAAAPRDGVINVPSGGIFIMPAKDAPKTIFVQTTEEDEDAEG